MSLVPASGFCLTIAVVVTFETSGVYNGFNNWDTDYKGWCVKKGIAMMAASIVFWLFLGIYLEIVMPKEFGKPLKPWFMF